MNARPPGENWRACDGKAEFANDPGVSKPLRGEKAPKNAGFPACWSVGGARVEGALSVQAAQGENFNLPATEQKRMAEGKGNATNGSWRCGNVGVLTANGDYLDVKFGVAGWGCFDGKMEAEPAIYEYHPGGTKVQGEFGIQPPTHVFLRAYVRTR